MITALYINTDTDTAADALQLTSTGAMADGLSGDDGADNERWTTYSRKPCCVRGHLSVTL